MNYILVESRVEGVLRQQLSQRHPTCHILITTFDLIEALFHTHHLWIIFVAED